MNQKIFKRRVIITGIIFFCLTGFAIIKIFTLHFSKKIKIKSSYAIDKIIHRGQIKDSKDHILAINIEKKSLYANPQEIVNKMAVAKQISLAIGVSEKKILNRIERKKRFVWIKRKLSDKEHSKLVALNIRGLGFKKEYQRVYPHGSLAANIIGFSGVDNNGLEGLEYKYNNLLNGADTNNPIIENKYLFGKNITLTIDKYIQYICEKILAAHLNKISAHKGVVIVTEVNSGKILALAKYPSFDPNKYSNYSANRRSNFSVVDSFEPGSTMKIFSVAAWLLGNSQNLKQKFYCPGFIEIADAKIKCTGVHNSINIFDAIRLSCNVAIIRAMQEIDKKTLFAVYKKFGFGEKTGINLPGESGGLLRKIDKWSGLSKYSLAIGQEISVTSLQLAAAYGAIANGGIYYSPIIIESITDFNGEKVDEFFPKSRGRILSKSNAKILKEMLRRVVTHGTGKKAQLKNYTSAGKTGTAQKSQKSGGYTEGKYVVSFAGFAPFQNPDICIIVIIDEPQIDKSGSKSAAPIFAEAGEKILNYRGISKNIYKAIAPLKKSGEITKFNGRIMPDFGKLDLADSVKLSSKISAKYTLKFNFIGSGRVYKQNPIPGTELNKVDKIILYLK